MLKKKFSLAFVFLFLLAGTFLVSAQPPFQSNVNLNNGLELYVNLIDSHTQNQPYEFHIHISNISNGYPLTNDIADCYIHAYNSSGQHTLESTAMTKDSNGYDYELWIEGGNFSDLGLHSIYYWCNSTNLSLGGQNKMFFEVTPSGTIPTTADAILYSLMLFLMLLLTGVALFGAFAIDGKNEYEMGKLIKINFNKYIKQGLFFFAYLFLTISMFFASEMAQRFFMESFATGILVWIHKFLWIALIPIFIIFVTFSLIKWLADIELMDLADRNLKPYGK